MKKTGPVVLGFIVGMLMMIQYFTPNQWINDRFNNILDWKQVVFGITLILGVISLCIYHWRKIESRAEGWGYSLVTIGGLVAMIAAQRAFEIESKVITTTDESLNKSVNQLGRVQG